MEQLDLLTAPPSDRVRLSDPSTSHDAAATVDVSARQREVLDALLANGGTGSIDTIMDAWPHRLRNSMSKRLSELREAGMVSVVGRETGRYGAAVTVWHVTERGRGAV